MPGKLDDKVAPVTGGSSGMGLATAELFAEEGAVVYITGRRQEPLDAASARAGDRLRGVVADASNLTDIEGLFATIAAESGRLDILFACAGVGKLTEPLSEVTPDSFDQLFGAKASSSPPRARSTTRPGSESPVTTRSTCLRSRSPIPRSPAHP